MGMSSGVTDWKPLDLPNAGRAPSITDDVIRKAAQRQMLSGQIGQTRQSTFLSDMSGKKLPQAQSYGLPPPTSMSAPTSSTPGVWGVPGTNTKFWGAAAPRTKTLLGQ